MISPLALRVDTTVLEPKTFSRRLTSSSVSPLLADTPRCASTSLADSACGASGNVLNALAIPASRKHGSLFVLALHQDQEPADERHLRTLLYKTVLNEFYRVAFRKKVYRSTDELQADLDAWIREYNETRPQQGRYCFGKTPMQTFLDAMPIDEGENDRDLTATDTKT